MGGAAPSGNAESSARTEQPIEQLSHVAYGTQLGQVDFSQDGFDTKAKVAGEEVFSGIWPKTDRTVI